MNIEIDGGDEKIAIERYKMYFERKKHLYEICKFFLWLSSTLIAVNTLSIGAQKFAGIIETNAELQNVFSYISIYALIYVISKILIVCFVTTSEIWKCNKTNNALESNCNRWLCEIRSLTECEIFCINRLYVTIKRSLFIIIGVLFISTLPILIHQTPLDKYISLTAIH